MLGKLKGSYKSLVIWFNGAALSLMGLLDLFHDSLSELSQYLPDNLYKKIGLTVVVANILLRFKTSKGLENK